MPELPEIEVIRTSLQRKIIGLKIKKVEVLSPKSFIGDVKQVEGKKIVKIWRRAKLLGIDLGSYQSSVVSYQTKNKKNLTTDDRRLTTLLFHLKMSGQLIFIPNDKRQTINNKRFIGGHPTEDMKGKMPNAHTRVIFTLVGQGKQKSRLSTLATSHLFFNDMRRFGWVRVINSSLLIGNSSLKKLGPEPLEKEFTWQVLKQNLLRHKGMPVKVAIMDQSIVAGVGNIYANEACFDAKIDPRIKVSALSDEQFKKLYGGIVKALKEGIKHGGSTRAHFVDPEGHRGYFLDYAYVYGRDKHPCKVCGTEIKKIQLGGRGTYSCPHCQKIAV